MANSVLLPSLQQKFGTKEQLEKQMRDRERIRLQQSTKKWSRKEENEFLRVLTCYGIDLMANTNSTIPNWTKFKAMARLEKKSDDSLSDYYKVFIAMCKRQAGVKLLDDEKGLESIIDDISEDHARLILDRLELLSKLREVTKSSKLEDRLRLCKNNNDTPDWWEPGKHDLELIRAILKHGLHKSEESIMNDPAFSFRDNCAEYETSIKAFNLNAMLKMEEELLKMRAAEEEVQMKKQEEEEQEAKRDVAMTEAEGDKEEEEVTEKENAEVVKSESPEPEEEMEVAKDVEAEEVKDTEDAEKTEECEKEEEKSVEVTEEKPEEEVADKPTSPAKEDEKEEDDSAEIEKPEEATEDSEEPKETPPEDEVKSPVPEESVVEKETEKQVEGETPIAVAEEAKEEETPVETAEKDEKMECDEAEPKLSTEGDEEEEKESKEVEVEKSEEVVQPAEKEVSMEAPTSPKAAAEEIAKDDEEQGESKPVEKETETPEPTETDEEKPSEETPVEDVSVEKMETDAEEKKDEPEPVLESTPEKESEVAPMDSEPEKESRAKTPTSTETEVAAPVEEPLPTVVLPKIDLMSDLKMVEEDCKKRAAELKARFPDLEVIQPPSKAVSGDDVKPTLPKLEEKQMLIRWFRDFALEKRVSHIVYCVEKNDWPVGKSYSAYTGCQGMDLDVPLFETIKRIPVAESSSGVNQDIITINTDQGLSKQLGNTLLQSLQTALGGVGGAGAGGMSQQQLQMGQSGMGSGGGGAGNSKTGTGRGRKRHIAIDVETERAKLHALLNNTQSNRE